MHLQSAPESSVAWGINSETGYTIAAFIHGLLVIALVLLLVQFVSGRRLV